MDDVSMFLVSVERENFSDSFSYVLVKKQQLSPE